MKTATINQYLNSDDSIRFRVLDEKGVVVKDDFLTRSDAVAFIEADEAAEESLKNVDTCECCKREEELLIAISEVHDILRAHQLGNDAASIEMTMDICEKVIAKANGSI